MKRRLLAAIVSVSFMIFFTLNADARLVSYSDLWDVSQGTVVTGSSGALSGGWSSDPSNMFGATNGSGPADLTNNTIFQDYQAPGYVHWVNWRTSTPVTLQSFNLVAIHDYDAGLNPYGEYRDINYRGISRFRLFWGDGSGSWTLLYDHLVNPFQDQGSHLTYGGGTNYPSLNWLELFANVPRTTAQYFRAEFTQYGSGSSLFGDAQGPRIYELDGYGPDSVLEGTIGTQITIIGTDFGSKKGKVLLGGVATKIAKDGWQPDSITCTVTKVPPPPESYPSPFDVTIYPQPYKTVAPITLPEPFSVMNPELDPLSVDQAVPGAEITITGKFFSTKKGKVYLEYEKSGQAKKKNCPVKYWSMDPITGVSEVRFTVPKGLEPGTYPLWVTNRVGSAATTFTIEP